MTTPSDVPAPATAASHKADLLDRISQDLKKAKRIRFPVREYSTPESQRVHHKVVSVRGKRVVLECQEQIAKGPISNKTQKQ